MTTLFCTPEQGQRLRELLPELKYALVWGIDRGEFKPMMKDKMSNQFVYAQPALTLQELIHIAIDEGFYSDGYQIDNKVWIIPDLMVLRKESVPYFAEEIIKVLEHQNKKGDHL
jgi:hypothetical protein